MIRNCIKYIKSNWEKKIQRIKTVSYTHLDVYKRQGINGDISQFPENKTPKSVYKIRLGEDGKFKMANQNNEPIADLSKGFISPNKTDFIYFDPNNGEIALAENMKPSAESVSYTHLDVYKRQHINMIKTVMK